MSEESQAYRTARDRLKQALVHILQDENASTWVLERCVDKVSELKTRFPDKVIGLISFDVDKIKEFVFTTAKPLEVQGASAMVKDLERNGWILPSLLRAFRLPQACIVFAGGGTGLLLVPAQAAPDFAQRLAARFMQKTGTGTCSVTWRAFAPHELVIGPNTPTAAIPQLPDGIEGVVASAPAPFMFGHIVRLLADQLREVKEEKAGALFPPLAGYLHRCESCAIEAASMEDRLRLQDIPDRICAHCLLKRRRGRGERHEGTPEETAVSINDIIGQEERGYFAVLYADANNMGQTLFKLQTMTDYALFSQAVAEVMNCTLRDLVRDHRLKSKYQAPVLGGDDLLLLLPAKKVVSVTADLIKQVPGRFEEKATQISGSMAQYLKDITLSIGFVIAPAHFAIRFAVDYAEEALLSAKKGKREKGQDCLDYLVIKDASPLNLSVEQLRKEHFVRQEEGRWALKLTTKPLTVSKFREMLTDIERLRTAGVTRSQLQQVENLLWSESPPSLRLNLRYQWLQVDSWKRFLQQSISNGDALSGIEAWLTQNVLRPTEEGDESESHFLDLLELYEFLE
jgi:hypothetical protein